MKAINGCQNFCLTFMPLPRKKHCRKNVVDILLTGFILLFSERFMLPLIKKKKKRKKKKKY